MLRNSKIIVPKNVLEKIERKHNVYEHEIYEVFENRPYIVRVEKGYRNGEDVYSAFGRTGSGRYLIVIFIGKVNGYKLVRSARDMDPSERKRYEQR